MVLKQDCLKLLEMDQYASFYQTDIFQVLLMDFAKHLESPTTRHFAHEPLPPIIGCFIHKQETSPDSCAKKKLAQHQSQNRLSCKSKGTD